MQNKFYRPDIDGLRALAVLPVVFYHANVPAFSGGFVGVDVFFVVSGYLITQILMRHIDEQAFSIAQFYERRVRRIAPALFFVLTVTTALATFLLLPDDLVQFAHSLIATVFFSSNFFFWSETGYFAAPAEFQPLLHTWSLAVEEQFYIVYPLFLLLVQRHWPRHLAQLLWLGLLSSLALSVWAVANTPGAAFYLPLTRAWELALGAVLAINAVPAVAARTPREICALLGISLVLWAVLTYTAQTPFPGLAALVPCLGAALFIHANGRGPTLAGKLLGARPLVAVGLISYSLYLWHWPLFVLAKYYLVRPLQPTEVIAVIGASFVLSYVSWRWVEQPVRRNGKTLTRRRLFVAAGCFSGLLIAMASGLLASHGLPLRFEEQELQLLAEARRRPADRLDCLDPPAREVSDGSALCVIGTKTSSGPSFVLWGDSHAEAIRGALEQGAEDAGVWGYFAFYVSCPPLLGLENGWKPPSHACAEFNHAMAEKVRRLGVTDVILAGMWSAYPTGRIQLVGSGAATVEQSMKAFVQGMGKTLAWLHEAGIRTWIIAQAPQAKLDVSRALAVRRRYGISLEDIEPTTDHHRERQEFVNGVFEEAARDPGVFLIDLTSKLCNSARCRVLAESHSLYSDDDHLSEYGARWVGGTFEPLFLEILRDNDGE